jgi:hypothetical protein
LNDTRNIIAIKSGSNWVSSSQIAKMRTSFIAAKEAPRTSSFGLHFVAINVCCYGEDNKPDKGDYFKLCGQRFWEFISGDSDLFTEIIEPFRYKTIEKKDEFAEPYALMVNKFTKEFVNSFCGDFRAINWTKLIQLNSRHRKCNCEISERK